MATTLNRLGETIESTPEGQAKLDRYIKNILAYKPILARIFKETVTECAELSYDEIESCIEGTIDIDIIGVNPGTSNPQKIEGRTQEDAVNGEGKITYDIRTVIRLPEENSVGVKLLIDVEAQKDDTPGYDIPERAIFYCARMLSNQLSTEFSNSSDDRKKYGNIKKVYSIWICTEVASEKANTIERYNLGRTVYPDVACGRIPRYDLMEAIIVNLSRDHNTNGSESRMINLLTLLFDESKANEEKLSRLKDYGIVATAEFEEEVTNMTAYAANLLNKGVAQGLAQGVAQGLAQGVAQGENTLVEVILRLKSGETKDKLVSSGVQETTIEKALRLLSQLQ